jgi:hypothetical protein
MKEPKQKAGPMRVVRICLEVAFWIWGILWLAIVVFVVWALLSPAPPSTTDPMYQTPEHHEGWTKQAIEKNRRNAHP